MEDTVGCRGDPSGRRNTAGSWRTAGRRVGTSWDVRRGAIGVVEYRIIGSRTSDRCASDHSPSTLSARQGQHTVLFGTGSVRRFIIRSFLWFQSVPQALASLASRTAIEGRALHDNILAICNHEL